MVGILGRVAGGLLDWEVSIGVNRGATTLYLLCQALHGVHLGIFRLVTVGGVACWAERLGWGLMTP